MSDDAHAVEKALHRRPYSVAHEQTIPLDSRTRLHAASEHSDPLLTPVPIAAAMRLVLCSHWSDPVFGCECMPTDPETGQTERLDVSWEQHLSGILADVVVTLLSERGLVMAEPVETHWYVPDYQAMGDCAECGNVRDSPIHATPTDKRPSS